jgi:16S rRNA (guanine527-N7)-methyltransferase
MAAATINHREFTMALFDSAKLISIEISDFQVEQLIKYLELLIKWNKTYNLTAIRDPKEMLTKHLIDSLSIAPHILNKKNHNILDVGTGPGLPGIPMSILYPEVEFLLLDSNGKKTRFLTQCKIMLGLKNVQVFNGRVEEANVDRKFDQILSRAFTSLGNMVDLCAHLLADDGQFLAMKGAASESEANDICTGFEIKESIELCVPGCDEQRHLIIIERSAS